MSVPYSKERTEQIERDKARTAARKQEVSDNYLRSVAMLVWSAMKNADGDRAVEILRELLEKNR